MERVKEDGKGTGSQAKVNLCTNGCCLLCLKPAGSFCQSNSIEKLCQRLKINLREIVSDIIKVPVKAPRGNRSFVDNDGMALCQDCDKVLKKYSDLFEKIDKIHMEMDYCLEEIQKCVLEGEGEGREGLFQGYRLRMNDSIPAMLMAGFFDELRKEICLKCCSIKHAAIQPQLHLNRLILREVDVDAMEIVDGDDDVAINSPSPRAVNNSVEEPENQVMSKKKEEKEGSLEETGGDSPSSSDFQKQAKCYRNRSTGKYHCTFPSCGKVCSSRPGIHEHFNSIHLNKRRNRNWRNSSGVKKARIDLSQGQEVSLSYEVDKKTKKIKCPMKNCDKLFTQKSYAVVHYKSFHLKVRWTCNKCKRANFKYPSVMRHHRMYCGRSQQCQKCNKMFFSDSASRKHIFNCNGTITSTKIGRNAQNKVRFEEKSVPEKEETTPIANKVPGRHPCRVATCLKTFGNKGAAQTHFLAKHQGKGGRGKFVQLTKRINLPATQSIHAGGKVHPISSAGPIPVKETDTITATCGTLTTEDNNVDIKPVLDTLRDQNTNQIPAWKSKIKLTLGGKLNTL